MIGEGQYHRRAAREACTRLVPPGVSKRLRHKIGSEVFAAQYQQTPRPQGGSMIRREWLRYWDKLPERTYRTEDHPELTPPPRTAPRTIGPSARRG